MNEASWSIQELYLRRPTLEYSQAFDLAASSLNENGERSLVVLSSLIHAAEPLKRCPGLLDYTSAGDFDAQAFAAQAQLWGWGTVQAAPLDQPSTYSAVLWAEPEASSAEQTALVLRYKASLGATLDVLASGPLRRFLPVWQTEPKPARDPASIAVILQLLKIARWKVERVIAFHGPRAIFWSLLVRAAGLIERPDWSDRCLFAMRAQYQEPGWLWSLAPLALIRARAL